MRDDLHPRSFVPLFKARESELGPKEILGAWESVAIEGVIFYICEKKARRFTN